ncbi:MAG: hypothetical protein IJ424_06265, partial [Oscillospiraceae bacterium]|nr:hypothetical protein [Oscillospiraceae bacterium]
MKKIISLLTSVLLLATLFVVPVNAETNYSRIEANATEYHVGDTVELILYIDLDKAVPTVGVNYAFDEDVLTLDEANSAWGTNGAMAQITFNGVYKAAWTNNPSFNFSTLTDGALKLSFKVNKLAEGGETELNFRVSTGFATNPDFVEDITVKLNTTCGNHTYGEWKPNDNETHIHSCTTENCGGYETADHVWNEGEETTAPTCCDTGVKTYTCTDCGAIKTEDVPATGEHVYGDWKDNGDGTHTKTCNGSNCSEFVTADHVWNEGEETTAPTCCDTGVKTYTCTDCGAIKTEDVPATGEHVYGDWKDNGDGTHTKTCNGSNCSEFVTADHVW